MSPFLKCMIKIYNSEELMHFSTISLITKNQSDNGFNTKQKDLLWAAHSLKKKKKYPPVTSKKQKC